MQGVAAVGAGIGAGYGGGVYSEPGGVAGSEFISDLVIETTSAYDESNRSQGSTADFQNQQYFYSGLGPENSSTSNAGSEK
jgi:hypothetical protein